MAQKVFRKNTSLYRADGSLMTDLHSDDNKNYAVIAKCGHCGRGYFIPIMFSIYCKDVYTAIERVKAIPRVKHDQKDVIIDAFEITQYQDYFIKAVCDHDPYLRGFHDKDSPEVESRRMLNEIRIEELLKQNQGLSESQLQELIKTAENYPETMVLQRYYAPTIQGGRVNFPKKVNRKQLIDDYFTQSTIRHGARKGNVYFMTLYYQIYGKNNPMGLVYDNGWFSYRDKDGKIHSYAIDDLFMEKLRASGVLERDKQIDLAEKEQKEFEIGNVKSVSAMDRFNRRMSKHIAKKEESGEREPGQ